jgi:hypothetical protein
MKSWKKYCTLLFLFTALGYPLFYYAYKYGTPEFGGLDVLSYYKLYTDWDFAAVDSPFNQRIISSYITFLLHKTGIHYSTETAMQGFGLDPQVYFCALLFNFACVTATCVVIYRIVEKHLLASPLFSFACGMLFLLGFGTLSFLLTALTDAFSVLLVALIFKYFLERSWWQLPFLLLAVFQREYIFFVFGLIAAMHWLFQKNDRKYYLMVLAASIGFFLVYFICRKTLFFTPRFNHQIAFDQFFANIAVSIQDFGAYIRQTFLVQNLLFLYFAIAAYKRFSGQGIVRLHLLIVFVLLAEAIVLSLLIRLGNNTGRYFYMTAPIIIFYLAMELQPLLQSRQIKGGTDDARPL